MFVIFAFVKSSFGLPTLKFLFMSLLVYNYHDQYDVIYQSKKLYVEHVVNFLMQVTKKLIFPSSSFFPLFFLLNWNNELEVQCSN